MDQDHLRDLEAQCIQECAPACVAACPLHVDARGISTAISQGDFSTALQLLKKTIPFPGIVCRVCEQPCRKQCLRHQAIAIADLERACLEFGSEADGKPANIVRRKQRVAIVGGGLNGLTAAHDLAKKRYSVVVFEAENSLGGKLRSISEGQLPHDVIEKDFSFSEKMGVEVRLNTPVGGRIDTGTITIAELQHEFDAIYLAVGENSPTQYQIGNEEGWLGTIDQVTHATSREKIFASLSLEKPGTSSSMIMSMADGRSAAISIDRFIQRVSLTASRMNEGPYKSCLYTNTEGVADTMTTRMNGKTFSREEAIREAGRCLQCECMECVKSCEYLSFYGGYPKKYARSIYNNLSIVMGTRLANKMINSCSLCGQCAEICPNQMDMGALCKEARQAMVTQGHMPPSAHDFALRDMEFSNSPHFAVARNQPGTESSKYVFFPGCQLSASSPQHVEKVYNYLRQQLAEVGLMLRCCGAPADWSGNLELFNQSLKEFSSLYASMGKPTLILACSSCYQVFKEHLPEIPIVSLWEIYDQYGLPAKNSTKKNGVLSIHDPCSTRHESKIHECVRRLVKQSGYQIEELPLNREKTSCCSFGGDMWLANRELAQKVIERRISESENDYLTYCAVCRDFFASKGKSTLHLLDLIYESDPEIRASRKGPGYSQRHENRARLKQKLLKKIWGETMPEQLKYESIKLEISDEVSQLLEERLILVEDIQQVIEYAERTGYKLMQPQTGRFLAHYKPTQVTYWVEYAPQEDGYKIYNAYSHRMEIGEELR
jgi:glutamate synthase (NADPH) small chain